MIWLGDHPDHESQTCEIKLKGAKLPDLRSISDHMRAISVGASLRSVEIRAVGEIVGSSDRLTLRISPGESVILRALTEKVQWNYDKKRAHPPSRAESTAFDRLKSNASRTGKQLEVTGPYRIDNQKQQILEVREFNWLSK